MRRLFSILLLLTQMLGTPAPAPAQSTDWSKAEVVRDGGYTVSQVAAVTPGSRRIAVYASTSTAVSVSSSNSYVTQLIAESIGPRGPPLATLVGRRIAAPAQSAASGDTLFLDTSGLENAELAVAPRLLRAAYAGNCLRVRRSSDNTEQDIGFVSNYVDTNSITTFIGAGDGFLVTWYDQSGNARNITQSTASLQYQIASGGAVLTGSNGKLRFQASGTRRMTIPNAFSGFTVGHVFAVIKVDSNGSAHWNFGSNGNDLYPFSDGKIYDNFATTARKDNITAAVTLTNWHMYEVLSKASLWTCWHNTTQSFTTATNTVGWDTSPTLEAFTGAFHELILYSDDRSAGQSAAYTDIDEFYALP